MIDEKVGLPELPEGQFWRVEKEFGFFWLSIIRITKVTKWSVWNKVTKDVASVVAQLRIDDESKEGLLRAADDCLLLVKIRAEKADFAKKFVGDYPPKKLEVL